MKFNAEKAMEQVRGKLSAEIEARDQAVKALTAAKAVRPESVRQVLVGLEAEIHKVNSMMLDALASGGDTTEPVKRKADLTERVDEQRRRLGEFQETPARQEAERKTKAALSNASVPVLESVALSVGKEIGDKVSALCSLMNEWNDFCDQMSVVLGERCPSYIPLHRVVDQPWKEFHDQAIILKDLAERVGNSASARNNLEIARATAASATQADPRRAAPEGFSKNSTPDRVLA